MTDKKEIRSLVAMVLFLIAPTLLGLVMASNIELSTSITSPYISTFLAYVLYFMAGIGIYSMGLALFKRRTFFYIATLTFVPAGIEIVHLILNKATTSLLFLYTCIIAEPGELWELFTTYWWVLLTAILLWVSYLCLNRHFIRNEYLIARPLWRYIIAGIGLMFFALCGRLQPVQQANPIDIVAQTAEVIRMQRTIRNADDALHNFRFEATYTGESDSSNTGNSNDLVVLIVGETSRYDHWQINGYSRPTSPLLAARKEQIISFDSCYSISNLTAISVPMMLSRATPDHIEWLYQEKSLPEAFKEAGYRTAWIADQSFTNTQLLRISSACDRAYYFDAGSKLHRSYMDSVLLPSLEQELKAGASHKQMIVLHSLGCHFKYSARYPDNYSVFQPDLKERDLRSMFDDFIQENGYRLRDKVVLNEVRELFVNSYDNAILYTDFFIDAVIQQIERTGRRAVLVYVGDHGENLLDDEKNMLMHGTFHGSKYEYHVPLLVWTSSQYRQAYANQVDALQTNTNKTMSTMYLFHSLLDAGHVAIPDWEPQSSIFSDSCQAQRAVIGLDANLNTKQIPL